ncbi:cytokine-inducible SH2-containing protein [Denticeps clupeoides]|uniref:Cytokine-inducible SH2-containing protein n=1 Tax=Denticeps clupeoides TaxID=299321 RepID=A0AAY4E3W0_9TELE|nr:cytokine-inducible SH2-containing protein [Denticeps clupeoides]
MILCAQGPRAILPEAPSPGVPLGPPQLWDASAGLRALISNFCYLDISGWYWGAITASEAHGVLQDVPDGTFLVRDSSHPLYMLTLSVRTPRGPTNVRIEYSYGRFRLDSTTPAHPRLRSFPDIPSLVQHYVGSVPGGAESGGIPGGESASKPESGKAKKPVLPLPDPQDNGVLLKLRQPLRRAQAFPSLQHLTRLTIHRHTSSTSLLPLPHPLLDFLKEYPFQL